MASEVSIPGLVYLSVGFHRVFSQSDQQLFSMMGGQGPSQWTEASSLASLSHQRVTTHPTIGELDQTTLPCCYPWASITAETSV